MFSEENNDYVWNALREDRTFLCSENDLLNFSEALDVDVGFGNFF